MKSVFKKVLLMLMITVLCLSAVTAYAATETQDGLKVTLKTDKKAYGAGEKIAVTLTLENESGSEIAPISVQYLLPQTCEPAANASMAKTIESLASGETLKLSTTAVVSEDPTEVVPQTGDDSNMFLWIALAGISVVGFCMMNAQQRKRLFAIVLCVAMTGGMLPAGVSTASAQQVATGAEAQKDVVLLTEDQGENPESNINPELYKSVPNPKAADGGKSLTVSEPIKVMGADTEVAVTVVYGGDVATGAYVYTNALGRNLAYTTTSNTRTRYSQTIGSGVSLPQSSHPYGYEVDELYYMYGGSGAYGMVIGFDSTFKLENNYDGLLIYSIEGDYMSGYTGTGLANMDYRLMSNLTNATNKGIILRLMTDYSVNYNGFRVTRAVPLKTPSINSVTVTSAGDVKLTWNKLYGYTGGYVIQRALVTNGVVGTYQTIKSVNSGSSTTYTDYTPEKGKTYAYRMAQVYLFGTDYYVGRYSSAKQIKVNGSVKLTRPYNFRVSSSSTSKIFVSWNAVTNADGYEIYRSTSENSGYTRVKRTTNTSEYISPVRTGCVNYYKVRAYTYNNGTYTYGPYSTIIGNYPTNKPKNLEYYFNGNGDIVLSWDKVSGAEKYYIYYTTTLYGVNNYCGATTQTYKTLTDVPDDLNPVYLKVRSQRYDGDVTSNSSFSGTLTINRPTNNPTPTPTPRPTPTPVVDPIEVRSLSIFEVNAPNCNPMRTVSGDMNLLNSMYNKASPYGRPVSVSYYSDQSKSQIYSRISNLAGQADSNDVSIFHMCCHGVSGITSGYQAGMLALSDGNYMTFGELANALDDIPGKVVIILTSCGSGSSINKAEGITGTFDEEAYLKEFVDTIAAHDVKEKTGELINSKFYVIATAQGGRSGYYYQDGYSILLDWMNSGVMSADTNSNGTVTLGEMQTFLTNKGNNTPIRTSSGYDYMHPQVYPNNSTFPLFQEN